MSKAYISMLRINHWFKNLFVLVGTVFALISIHDFGLDQISIFKTIVAVLLTCLVSSSNYIINQITDKDQDNVHPEKSKRPIASGKIGINRAFSLSVFTFVLPFTISVLWYSSLFASSLALLWIAGFFYNVRPVRLKDRMYIDVVSESINNPIRFLIGWSLVPGASFPPISLLFTTWFAGGILMSAKRYDELKTFGISIEKYRHTFGKYTLTNLSKMIHIYSLTTLVIWCTYLLRYEVQIFIPFTITVISLATLVKYIISGKSEARETEKFMRSKNFIFFVTINTLIYLFVFLA